MINRVAVYRVKKRMKKIFGGTKKKKGRAAFTPAFPLFSSN
jgi:hypothetical protein